MNSLSSTVGLLDPHVVGNSPTNDSTKEDLSGLYKSFAKSDDMTDTVNSNFAGMLIYSKAGIRQSISVYSYELQAYAFLESDSGLSIQVVSMESDMNQLKEKFESLSAQWRKNTAFFSTVKEIALDSNYQQIIGMGEPVVPLILNDLQKRPSHWYWALAAITGENPAKDSPKGNIQAVCDAWVDCGRRRGLLR